MEAIHGEGEGKGEEGKPLMSLDCDGRRRAASDRMSLSVTSFLNYL